MRFRGVGGAPPVIPTQNALFGMKTRGGFGGKPIVNNGAGTITITAGDPSGHWAIDNNWSVKAEYLYIDTGNFSTTGLAAGDSVATVDLSTTADAHKSTSGNWDAGTWEIDVELNLTTSGKEFTQLVKGVVGYDQAASAEGSAQ